MAGDTGFILARDPDTVRGPAIAYLSYERFAAEEELALHYGEMIPDLAVEVVSHSDTRRYLLEKTASWLADGIQVVWVVDPALGR